MFHPAGVDVAEQDDPLDLTQHLGAEQPLFGGVDLQREFREFFGQLVARGDLAVGEAERVRREQEPEVLGIEPGEVPRRGILSRGVLRHVRRNRADDHILHRFVQILAVQHLAPLLVDQLALLVHHVVVFKDVLPAGEVLRLDPFLRVLDRPREDPGIDGRVFVKPQPRDEARDPIGPEQPHQIVFEREEEARFAGVALTAAPSA